MPATVHTHTSARKTEKDKNTRRSNTPIDTPKQDRKNRCPNDGAARMYFLGLQRNAATDERENAEVTFHPLTATAQTGTEETQARRRLEHRTARTRYSPPRVHSRIAVFTEPHRALLCKPETTCAHIDTLLSGCFSAALRDLHYSFSTGVLATALYRSCRLRQSHRSLVLPSASFASCRCAATLSTGGCGIIGNSPGLLVTSAA